MGKSWFESIKVETPDVPDKPSTSSKLKFKTCKSSVKAVTISKSVNSRSLRNGNRKIHYSEKDILVFNNDISVFKLPEASVPKRSGFDCDFCGKNFNQKVNLLTHCNRVHCDSKSFSCDFCSARSFSRQLDLTRHISVCHEKKFRCKICSKNFGQKSVLQIHLKTVHLKVRDFACAFCDLSFGTNSSLKRHAASRHKTKVSKQCDQMLRSDHSDSQPQADPLTIESSVYKLDTLKTEPEFQSECNFDEDIDIKFEPLEDVEESWAFFFVFLIIELLGTLFYQKFLDFYVSWNVQNVYQGCLLKQQFISSLEFHQLNFLLVSIGLFRFCFMPFSYSGVYFLWQTFQALKDKLLALKL